MKSFHLVKWSSWSLINESHLNTRAVCSPLPSAELCHPGQPLLDHTMHFWQLCLAPWATVVRMGLSPPWVVHDHSAEAGACPGYPYFYWCIPGAVCGALLTLPCPGSMCRGTFCGSIIWGRIHSVLVPLKSVTRWPSPS